MRSISFPSVKRWMNCIDWTPFHYLRCVYFIHLIHSLGWMKLNWIEITCCASSFSLTYSSRFMSLLPLPFTVHFVGTPFTVSARGTTFRLSFGKSFIPLRSLSLTFISSSFGQLTSFHFVNHFTRCTPSVTCLHSWIYYNSTFAC